MRTIAIIQARMGSSRLPGKVLMDLHGETTLGRVVMAARAIAGVDAAVVATSAAPSDDPVAAWCEEQNIRFYRGPENDVLERMRIAAKGENAEIVMRLTADCRCWTRRSADSAFAARTDKFGLRQQCRSGNMAGRLGL